MMYCKERKKERVHDCNLQYTKPFTSRVGETNNTTEMKHSDIKLTDNEEEYGGE